MDTSGIKTSQEAAAFGQALAVKLQVLRVRALTLGEILTSVQEKADTAATQIQLLSLQLEGLSTLSAELKSAEAGDGHDSDDAPPADPPSAP